MEGITETVIRTSSGQVYSIPGGYLDIGILDTMKDLLVNLIGAVVFCSFGYAFLKYGEKKKIASAVVQGLRLEPDRKEETGPETDADTEERESKDLEK